MTQRRSTRRSSARLVATANPEPEEDHNPPPVARATRSSRRRSSTATAANSHTPESLAARTVPELKDLLRAAGLPLAGRKAELIERLLAPKEEEPKAATTTTKPTKPSTTTTKKKPPTTTAAKPEPAVSSRTTRSSRKRKAPSNDAADAPAADPVPSLSPLPSSKKAAPATPATPRGSKKKAAATPSSSSSKTKKSSKKSPSPRKKLPETRKAPKDWESLYSLVEELRNDRTAPVDTDGSEALPQTDLGEPTYRFQVLVALMLSSQTKDAVVGDAMRKLQAHGLTVENLRQTSHEDLDQLIWRVGFHNTKTKNLKKVVEILHEEYGGDIPPTAAEMIDKLPGIGPKMAYIIENVALKTDPPTGIGIDTHMHRMFNQLKWVDSKQPEQTRLQLESWLPIEHWSTVNLLWVGMGQEVQQFQPKLLRKALDCSRPYEALKLLPKLGLDVRKVGTKAGWREEVDAVLAEGRSKSSSSKP